MYNGGKSVWWNNEIKAAVRRKESVWKGVLAASKSDKRKMYGSVQRGEKVNRRIIQSKNKVNKQLGRKMNEDVNGNRKLFWKEISNAKGEKVESCSRVKGGNGVCRTKRESSA